jgi:hypothetical protein
LSYVCRMAAICICDRLRAWSEFYPDRSAPAERNAVARAVEDEWLDGFAGLDALERGQVVRLINWKFQSMAHRRALALRGVSPERWEGRNGAGELVRRALADQDDDGALTDVCGIYRFGPAMGSVVLAACRPGRFTIADSRALATLRRLGRMPPGPQGFRRADWLPYLNACRSLASLCGLSLREVDRVLWVAADDPGIPDSEDWSLDGLNQACRSDVVALPPV